MCLVHQLKYEQFSCFLHMTWMLTELLVRKLKPFITLIQIHVVIVGGETDDINLHP